MLSPQVYVFGYGLSISLFSPTATLYQMLKLNPNANTSKAQGARLALRILPAQTVLKFLQMNAAKPVRDNLNPWAAFGVVGILQGGVYGQANVSFARALKIGKQVSYAGIFRGYGFAACRDMLSQGIPYVFSKDVERVVFDPVVGKISQSEEKKETIDFVKRYAAVLSTSAFATYASQGFHNMQLTMQTDQTLSHFGAFRKAFDQFGFRVFYRGAEARIALLFVVNVLNEALLKKAWEK